MLVITRTDLVNAIVLLLGILLLPTNIHMMYGIAKGQKIDYQAKIICCPLWLCILWIIVISCVGVILCMQRIYKCDQTMSNALSLSMNNYRSVPKYKHFIDNVQWSLKCCGLKSYKDWFKQDWYDKIREYEWDPSNKHKRDIQKENINSVADSVPLSCCKSGSCVSNFLLELGTHSIHSKGCNRSLYRIIMISMIIHLIVFNLIIIAEILLLKYITGENNERDEWPFKPRKLHVRHLTPLVNNFEQSSGSSSCNPDDSDDCEVARKYNLEGGEVQVDGRNE